ncbi:unnamed protein product, partial [Symbiodinium pilosum]
AGSLVGGAIGILPALFTFGLSIPVGAAIGGGAGLAVGAAAGATAGAVSGGAAGYGAYAKRGQISEFKQNTVNKDDILERLSLLLDASVRYGDSTTHLKSDVAFCKNTPSCERLAILRKTYLLDV